MHKRIGKVDMGRSTFTSLVFCSGGRLTGITWHEQLFHRIQAFHQLVCSGRDFFLASRTSEFVIGQQMTIVPFCGCQNRSGTIDTNSPLDGHTDMTWQKWSSCARCELLSAYSLGRHFSIIWWFPADLCFCFSLLLGIEPTMNDSKALVYIFLFKPRYAQ